MCAVGSPSCWRTELAVQPYPILLSASTYTKEFMVKYADKQGWAEAFERDNVLLAPMFLATVSTPASSSFSSTSSSSSSMAASSRRQPSASSRESLSSRGGGGRPQRSKEETAARREELLKLPRDKRPFCFLYWRKNDKCQGDSCIYDHHCAVCGEGHPAASCPSWTFAKAKKAVDARFVASGAKKY